MRVKNAFGLGLRPPFYKAAAAGEVAVDWFEVITENFMVDGGNPLKVLDAVRSHYPVALHGVSMNFGGTDPLDEAYLQRLADLITRVNPVRISDHLCWTRHGGHHLHDLLPLPYREDVIDHVAHRISHVQDRLGCQILIENVSSYAESTDNEMPEWAFLTAVAERADCSILLDLNNIVVSAHNHGFNPRCYIEAIPLPRVQQIHLAGHSTSGPLLIDTHDHPVPGSVYDLYAGLLPQLKNTAVMIERDDNIPPLPELLAELAQVQGIHAQAIAA